jgi:aspartate carbamoyltransferase catalytic subunit
MRPWIAVGLVGDLANGRTVRSLASMLTNFDNVQFVFIAPDVVRMGAGAYTRSLLSST